MGELIQGDGGLIGAGLASTTAILLWFLQRRSGGTPRRRVRDAWEAYAIDIAKQLAEANKDRIADRDATIQYLEAQLEDARRTIANERGTND